MQLKTHQTLLPTSGYDILSLVDSIILLDKKKEICFWCECELNNHTRSRDHIISRPIFKYLKLKKRKHCRPTKIACKNCNGLRASISTLCAVLHRAKKSVAHGRFDNFVRNFLRGKEKLLPLLFYFRHLTVRKLDGKLAEICLLEIDTIMSETIFTLYDFKVGDRVRILRLPVKYGQPDYYMHPDTVDVFKRLIARKRSVRIRHITEDGFPVFRCQFRIDGIIHYHEMTMLSDDNNWVKVKPRKNGQAILA